VGAAVKGGITLAIYIAIGITGAAFGQNVETVKTVKTIPIFVKDDPFAKAVSMQSTPVPPSWKKPVALTPALAPEPERKTAEIARSIQTETIRQLAALPGTTATETVVINKGMGGSIPEHELRYRLMAQTGAAVEMRGQCWSACTLVTAYIPKERLCFGPGAFLAFHAALNNMETRAYAPQATALMYASYPPEIQAWIDRHGGWERLTANEYWTMYDRELWAMGYPKCK
jgi:hypothetical protein